MAPAARALCALACALACAVREAAAVPLYKDASAPVDARVADLLSRMTLEEKVAQMLNPVGNVNGPGHFSVNAEWLLANYNATGLGTVYVGVNCNGAGPGHGLSGFDCQNYLQSSMINASRLNIPISFIGETLVSGVAHGTIFPQPVLMGATFNASLISELAASIGRQARLGGIDRGLSPVLQVDTDARFGRFEESYGEDPFLVSTMGVAAALALQGSNAGPSEYLPDFTQHISLEAKHFFAYGAGGRDWYGAELSDRLLYDVYLRPWKHFIRDAGGRGVMVAHPSVNGLPLHGSRKALTDVLRAWLGNGQTSAGGNASWTGLIASDWGNVEQITNYGVAADTAHAAMLGAWAGMDNTMSPPPQAFSTLVDSVNAGLINISYIDRAAGNNLRVKFANGLFDGAWQINVTAANAGLDTPADRELARRVAAEGIVLLKNDKGVLPLQGVGSTIKKIAVLGPLGGCLNGEGYPCGAQQGTAGHYVQYGAPITTLVQALNNSAAAGGFTVGFEQGVAIPPAGTLPPYNVSGIPAAVALAQGADAVLIAVGDSIPISTGSCSEMSDTDDTNLPAGQLQLINDTINALAGPDGVPTKPVVVVLLHCRPVTFGSGPFSAYGPNNALLGRIPALVSAWRPGEEGGTAVWQILTGGENPSGRLTQNWIRHVGALHGPASPYLQYKGAEIATYYAGDPPTPLFGFGYGLSYTNFTVTGLKMSAPANGAAFQADETATITGSVSSVGPAGRFSVLVYFSQDAPTKWTRNRQQLCAFTKVFVPANSAGTPFTIPVSMGALEAYEPDTLDFEVHSGSYTFSVGGAVTEPMWGSFPGQPVNGTYAWTWDFTQ